MVSYLYSHDELPKSLSGLIVGIFFGACPKGDRALGYLVPQSAKMLSTSGSVRPNDDRLSVLLD
jgi:hypothetical protein